MHSRSSKYHKAQCLFSNTNIYLCDATFFKEIELQLQFIVLSASYQFT